MNALRLLCAALAGGAMSLTFAPVDYGPRLAGYGCVGANGPIYADAESDFPPCVEIIALR